MRFSSLLIAAICLAAVTASTINYGDWPADRPYPAPDIGPRLAKDADVNWRGLSMYRRKSLARSYRWLLADVLTKLYQEYPTKSPPKYAVVKAKKELRKRFQEAIDIAERLVSEQKAEAEQNKEREQNRKQKRKQGAEAAPAEKGPGAAKGQQDEESQIPEETEETGWDDAHKFSAAGAGAVNVIHGGSTFGGVRAGSSGDGSVTVGSRDMGNRARDIGVGSLPTRATAWLLKPLRVAGYVFNN